MSIYTLKDLSDNNIVINSNSFDTIVFRDILENEFNLDVGRNIIDYDSLRSDVIYKYFYLLNDFVDSRQENFDKLPIDKIERTGSSYSVLMTNGGNVEWKRLAKPIKGTIRLNNDVDQSIIFFHDTFISDYFINLDNLEIVSNLFTTNISIGRAITAPFYQDFSEENWSSITGYIEENITSVTDIIPEKTDMTNNIITILTKDESIEVMEDLYLMDSNGTNSKVIDVISKEERLIVNSVGNTCATSRYNGSVIKEDGSISIWGDTTSTTYYLPPSDVKFTTIGAGDLTFAGVTDDNKIYVWGRSTTTQYLRDRTPTGNDFISADCGYNYALALKEDGSLYSWGYTTYMSSSYLPTGTFKKIIASPKIGFALGEDGYLKSFGKYDSYYLKRDTPTMKLKDFSVGYKNGVYLTEDGIVGQWGSLNGYYIPDFGDKVIESVYATRDTFHAKAEDGTHFHWGYYYYNNYVPLTHNFSSLGQGYGYVSVLVDENGGIKTWYKSSGTSYDNMILFEVPNDTVIMNGIIVGGYEYQLKLETSILEDDINLISSNLYYSTVAESTDDNDYTLIPKNNIIYEDDVFKIDFDTLEINTNTLNFMYKVNNRFERPYRIQVDLTKGIIGEAQ